MGTPAPKNGPETWESVCADVVGTGVGSPVARTAATVKQTGRYCFVTEGERPA